MRRHRMAVALAAALVFASPAAATPIYTFGVSGTTNFDTSSIFSYSVDLVGSGGTFTFVKEIDAATPYFTNAVGTGQHFPTATFIAYDGAIAPELELFRYAFTEILFTGIQFGGTLTPVETVTLSAARIVQTDGPATVPEPASLLLVSTGLLGAGVRRRRRGRTRD
jgi:Type VI secretion system effector, Hcp/PEP-CTERM motif